MRVIKTAEQHRLALERVSELMDITGDLLPGDADELELLVVLLQDYERKAFPSHACTSAPPEVIRAQTIEDVQRVGPHGAWPFPSPDALPTHQLAPLVATREMCVALVKQTWGAGIYERHPKEVLDAQERGAAETFEIMMAAFRASR